MHGETSNKVFLIYKNMKLIPLSIKSKTLKGKYFAMVDDEDYEYLNIFYWSVKKSTKTMYSGRYAQNCNVKTFIYMHRLILGVTDSKIFVDHKDHDGLNNQRSNIRVATPSENKKNVQPHGKSKYLGVNLDRFTKKNKEYSYWRAQIFLNGKNKNLGRFNSETDAAKRYDSAAKFYHGDFANLNFKEVIA